jgi:carbon catabolite-derepressing protein kinase
MLLLSASSSSSWVPQSRNQPDNYEANLGADNPYFPSSPPTQNQETSTKISGDFANVTIEDPNVSPLLDPAMSSARSITSTSTGASPRPYVSKVGILPSSLPGYHTVYMEREKAKAAGINVPDPAPAAPDGPRQPRTQAEQEETARRLKPHSRSQLRLDEANKRPQGLTPVNPPAKRHRPVRWQFGIRSRNAAWEALVCIYKALAKLGAGWQVDDDNGNDGDEYASSLSNTFIQLRTCAK